MIAKFNLMFKYIGIVWGIPTILMMIVTMIDREVLSTPFIITVQTVITVAIFLGVAFIAIGKNYK